MPKIIKDADQLAALDNISKSLDKIRSIDAITAGLSADDGTCDIELHGKKNTGITLSRTLNAKIITVLSHDRVMTAKNITAAAKKYRIQLDDEEMNLISASP